MTQFLKSETFFIACKKRWNSEHVLTNVIFLNRGQFFEMRKEFQNSIRKLKRHTKIKFMAKIENMNISFYFWRILEIREHFLNFTYSDSVTVGRPKLLSVRVAGYLGRDCSIPSVPNRFRVPNRPGLKVQCGNFRDSKFSVWFSFRLQLQDLFWTFFHGCMDRSFAPVQLMHACLMYVRTVPACVFAWRFRISESLLEQTWLISPTPATEHRKSRQKYTRWSDRVGLARWWALVTPTRDGLGLVTAWLLG